MGCVRLFYLYISAKMPRGGGGGRLPYGKGAGMLVVSLRGVNFGFWSHLGLFQTSCYCRAKLAPL